MKRVIKIKIINQTPKTDNDRHATLLQQQWKPLKEPKSIITAMIGSIPFVILNGIITLFIIRFVSSISFEELGFSNTEIMIEIDLMLLFSILIMVIIHELIHLFFVPNFMKSDRTYIGLTWFGGYVYTEEIISKGRYLWIALAPFVLLSIILPLVLGMLGWLTTPIKVLILLNALGSSVDLLGVFLVLLQVPAHSQLVNNGIITYWKKKN
ncbi:DUF3267 domain-containing protein [Hazenella coriacea]|uniref:Putative zincin peptidase n=1 Tax=Hazenella coriacea TaxID=1179467 RepID=A0A4R3L7F9_9BACL|nr:DUF3267 domain-containing protein [Hazenella coriacea]TCS95038.1 putative zincin peptidase [Hazenella coriacea]